MSKFIDLTGQKFGRLTVLYRGDKVEHGKSVKWLCECECGNKCWVTSGSLRSGNTESCGCLKKDINIEVGKRNKGKRYKFNTFEILEDYVVGHDDKNNSFYIDIEDLDKVKKYCWYKGKGGYWMTSYVDDFGNKKHLKLHKYLTNTGVEQIIDHHDRNKDNNRKSNLLFSTKYKNARNSSVAKNNTSGFIGVSYNKSRKEWKAQVTQHGKELFLGWYKDKEQAIKARLEGELKYYGEDAPQRHLFNQYGIEVSKW